MRSDREQQSEWKRGLPPGKWYEGMVDDYEVYFSPGGWIWHRRKEKKDRTDVILAAIERAAT